GASLEEENKKKIPTKPQLIPSGSGEPGVLMGPDTQGEEELRLTPIDILHVSGDSSGGSGASGASEASGEVLASGVSGFGEHLGSGGSADVASGASGYHGSESSGISVSETSGDIGSGVPVDLVSGVSGDIGSGVPVDIVSEASGDFVSGVSGVSGDFVSGVSGDFVSSISGDFVSSASGDIVSGVSGDFVSSASGDIVSGVSGDFVSSASGDIGTVSSGEFVSGVSGDIASGASGDLVSEVSGDLISGSYRGFVSGISGELGSGPSGESGLEITLIPDTEEELLPTTQTTPQEGTGEIVESGESGLPETEIEIEIEEIDVTGMPTCLLCTCLGGSVYCDDVKLVHVPPLPKDTTHFYARYNKIAKINKSDFANMKYLHTALQVKRGGVHVLPELRDYNIFYFYYINICLKNNYVYLVKILIIFLYIMFPQNNNIQMIHEDTFCHVNDLNYIRYALEDVRLDGNPVNLSRSPQAYVCLPRIPVGALI
uniref:Epiphycan n=1 Tax=Astyanax mexicanus TaxID=7994 RepID=A0A8B9JD75_ASTMX